MAPPCTFYSNGRIPCQFSSLLSLFVLRPGKTVKFFDSGSIKSHRTPEAIQIADVLDDPAMIRNRRKIGASVENARVFLQLVKRCGSFTSYVDSLHPSRSLEELLLFKEELQSRFVGLAEVTTYRVLTDLGLPVLKPDRAIMRIFQRLGLVERSTDLLRAAALSRAEWTQDSTAPSYWHSGRTQRTLSCSTRTSAHVARRDAAHALERAAERRLRLIAQPIGDLRHRRARP